MNSLVVSGLVLLVLLLLAIFWSRGKKGKALPYDLQETLFSPAERSFLGVLDLAVGDQARVFAKVRVADVLTPETGMGKSKWQQAFNKISAKHVDYLLCHPSDLSFICAIELDDSSHRHQKRKVRDSFLKAAFDSAGLPLLQIPASSHYQVEELREQILPLLSGPRRTPDEDLLPGDRREPTFSPCNWIGSRWKSLAMAVVSRPWPPSRRSYHRAVHRCRRPTPSWWRICLPRWRMRKKSIPSGAALSAL